MRRGFQPKLTACALAATILILSGCTSLNDYVKNGFKVGPWAGVPKGETATNWIDAVDVRVRKDSPDLSRWWTVFNDPVLNSLINDAYQQNLTLKQACFRVLEARAQLGIARGEFFPQLQDAFGSYARQAVAVGPGEVPFVGSRFSSQWRYGFSLAWELDFWGRFRRAIQAADHNLSASIEDYDDVLVTLLGDVATNYVAIRVLQQQIALAKANVDLQRGVLRIVQARLEGGRTSELDVDQAQSNLSQIEAQIPQFEITLRQAENRLCTLLGMPPTDLHERLAVAPIPAAPSDAAVGIPAELLARRPDVRRAEFNAAAQAEQIGIAEADFYPAVSITGTLAYSAEEFADLFRTTALNGNVGPSFQWNLLNYGRILNNVRLQDARFQELVLFYWNTVLQANAEAENGLVAFLRSQQRTKHLEVSVEAAEKAVNIVITQYQVGTVDFNRVALIEQTLVQQQDLLAQARGQIAVGLIQVYRALGGGWQIREAEEPQAGLVQPPAATTPAEPIPLPRPIELPPPKTGEAAPKAEPVPLPAPNALPAAPKAEPVVPKVEEAAPKIEPAPPTKAGEPAVKTEQPPLKKDAAIPEPPPILPPDKDDQAPPKPAS